MKYLLIMVFGFCLFAEQTHTTKNYGQVFATGLKRDEAKFRSFMQSTKRASFTEMRADIPDSASVCEHVHIANQGALGSCWDFSLTNTLETTYRAAGVEKGRLNFNYLLSWSPYCDGGDFDAAAWFINQGLNGVYLESDYPYQARCVGKKTFPIKANALSYTMLGTNGRVTFKDIAYAIGVLHKPVSVDVAATSAWMNYSDGIYNGNGTGINHMVGICSYSLEGTQLQANGEPPSGKGYVTVYNSWGNWGKAVNGQYGFMDSRLHANQLGQDALIFDIDVPVPVPPSPVPPSPSPVPPTPPTPSNWPWEKIGVIVAIVLGVLSLVIAIVKK